MQNEKSVSLSFAELGSLVRMNDKIKSFILTRLPSLAKLELSCG
jgi:hypothetical protein